MILFVKYKLCELNLFLVLSLSASLEIQFKKDYSYGLLFMRTKLMQCLVWLEA